MCDTSLARTLAFAHHQLIGAERYAFVAQYLSNPSSFEKIYDENANPACLELLLCLVFLLVVATPFIYAWTVMPYPCIAHSAFIGGEHMVYQQADCDKEDFLRSPVSLLVGPILCFLVCAPVQFNCLPDRAKVILHKLLEVRGSNLQRLNYHKTAFYKRYACGCYWLFMVEMVALTLYLRAPLAAIVGYAVGEALMQATNLLVSPSPSCIALLDAKIEQWPLFKRLSTWSLDTFVITGKEKVAMELDLQGPLKRLAEQVKHGSFLVFMESQHGFADRSVPWDFLQLQTVFVDEGTESVKHQVNMREGTLLAWIE